LETLEKQQQEQQQQYQLTATAQAASFTKQQIMLLGSGILQVCHYNWSECERISTAAALDSGTHSHVLRHAQQHPCWQQLMPAVNITQPRLQPHPYHLMCMVHIAATQLNCS
jgi:hypothetical protein